MTIAVLLSGGVDSSVVLHKLARENCSKLRAFYLKIWLEDELAYLGECPWEDDLKYARQVCDALKVPLEVIPLQTEYWQKVVTTTISELQAGRTPSPDILCNQMIKYGAFLEKLSPEFSTIASGHYAQVERQCGQAQLKKGKDREKDQTYFLSSLSLEQIQKVRFPIGDMLKSEVRSYANKVNLPNSQRPDSQGICFLGKIPFREFVRFHLGNNPGSIRELVTGKKLGQHNGLWFHTIGQRKGLGLGGGPWYVVSKNTEDNTLFVSLKKFRHQVDQTEFRIHRPHWIAGPPASSQLHVKIRHGRKTIPCHLQPLEDSFHVTLKEADQGIAPGQYAVFYDNEICLGSGLIA